MRWSLSASLFRAACRLLRPSSSLSRGRPGLEEGKAALLLAPNPPSPLHPRVKNTKAAVTISHVAEIISYHSIHILADQRAFSLQEEFGHKVQCKAERTRCFDWDSEVGDAGRNAESAPIVAKIIKSKPPIAIGHFRMRSGLWFRNLQ